MPPELPPRAQRIRTCLLAGALGDAWGSPYEGLTGPISAPFPQAPRLSDDTWLTAATCEAIVDSDGSADAASVAANFKRWFEAGLLRGLGSSTLKALRDLSAGAHWALAGARGEYAAGAGAAMRIAPLAFILNPDDPKDRVLVRDVVRITHHSDEAYAGALAMTTAIRLVMDADNVPEELLSVVVRGLPDTRVRDRCLELSDSAEDLEAVARRYGASGYVVNAVPLALLAAASERTAPVDRVIERAVALGGDADTIASMAAQIAAAAGADLPQDLLSQVSGIARVDDVFIRFAAQVAKI